MKLVNLCKGLSLNSVSIAVLKKQNHKQLGLFCFILPHHNLSWKEFREGTRGGHLEVRTKAGAIKEQHLLVCSPWLPLPAFLERPGPPAQGSPPTVTGPFHINQQSKMVEALPQVSFPLQKWFWLVSNLGSTVSKRKQIQNEHLRNKGHSYAVLAQGQQRYRCRCFLKFYLRDGKLNNHSLLELWRVQNRTF